MGKDKKKKKKLQEPLDTTMSLGDHIEELRGRLILAIAGLLIGAGISLSFGTWIIKFIEKPYYKVFLTSEAKSETEEKEKTIKFIEDLFNNTRQKLADDPNTPNVGQETEEFVYKFCTEILVALSNDPNYTSISPSTSRISPARRLQILRPADGIISYIKIALMAGLILSSPWVFYQIWMFVAAGLYVHERKYVHTAVPFSAALFVTGALFFILIVAPLTLKFLVKFNEGVLDARSNFTFADYISFITMLMLIFGVAFQTPIAIFFLNRTGLVSIPALRKSRKFVLLGIFVVAAMATPPDVISQVTLGIPLYILFELGILLAVFSERRRKSKEKAA
ncbi:MAG: twin-arginine translocase subunit TatC [Planctomycetes bacterium B3_Pla]|nr:MAG: twin-arginine translocase subunit TatC [Planctomycetes bacterium B3_Pla]